MAKEHENNLEEQLNIVMEQNFVKEFGPVGYVFFFLFIFFVDSDGDTGRFLRDQLRSILLSVVMTRVCVRACINVFLFSSRAVCVSFAVRKILAEDE